MTATTVNPTASTVSAPTAIPFGPQLIGQVEKSLNGFLHRCLAGSSLNETQWVTLSLTVTSGGTLDGEQLITRVAGVLKTGDEAAAANIAALEAAGLVQIGPEGSAAVTEAGRTFFGEVRGATAEFTQQLWGDVPAEDLEVAARVLGTVLARANVLLGVA